MTQSITTKALSLGIAAMFTLTIMVSLDALARSEQTDSMAAANAVTQTACIAPVTRI